MKTITLVAHRRPQYLARVLESIAANDTTGYSLVAVLDGGPVDGGVIACSTLLENFDALPKIIYRPTENLGVNYANRYVYRQALALGSVMNVAVEDDTPLAPDCLTMVNWWAAREKFLNHEWLMNCFSKSLYRRAQDVIMRCKTFCPWVWAASSTVLKYLTQDGIWMCDENGWDWSIGKILSQGCPSPYYDAAGKFVDRGHVEFSVVEPVVSRSSNIGRDGGVHYTHELFDEHFSKHVASDGTCRDYKFVE